MQRPTNSGLCPTSEAVTTPRCTAAYRRRRIHPAYTIALLQHQKPETAPQRLSSSRCPHCQQSRPRECAFSAECGAVTGRHIPQGALADAHVTRSRNFDPARVCSWGPASATSQAASAHRASRTGHSCKGSLHQSANSIDRRSGGSLRFDQSGTPACLTLSVTAAMHGGQTCGIRTTV